LERFMYEVLGKPALDVFSYISVDTDSRPKQDEPTPAGRSSASFPAYVRNLGMTWETLNGHIEEAIQWCPSDITIPGPGAGNLRAGGRIMLYENLRSLQAVISQAVTKVSQAAHHPASANEINQQLAKRGLPAEPQPVDPNSPIVYVVATLGGGTGSGMCVDLGYMIHEVLPGTFRTGLFFVAGTESTAAFVENSWAAVQDLEYFCENPYAFNPIWPTGRRGGQVYHGGPGGPYDQAFLLTTQLEHGNPGLTYECRDTAPLISMVGLQLAADLLGMSLMRAAQFANINNHVPNQPRYKTLFNFNLRAVSYPKYEISEAAAARIISDKICANWLDGQHAQSLTGPQQIREEMSRKDGREYWNNEITAIWQGIRANVELPKFVNELLAGDHPKWIDAILHRFSGDVDGTFYRQVADARAAQLSDWKRMVNRGLGEKLIRSTNLTVAEFYLQGMLAEIERTLKYWNGIGVPQSNSTDAWKRIVRDSAAEINAAHPFVTALFEKKNLVRDQLEQLLLLLEMFLMRESMEMLTEWIRKEKIGWLQSLRSTLKATQDMARERHDLLLHRLNDGSGPILRITRGRELSFAAEISQLAAIDLPRTLNFISLNAQGEFEGLFITEKRDNSPGTAVFIELKRVVQPIALAAIEAKGQVAIVNEIQQQGLLPQAASAINNARQASFYPKTNLIKDPQSVPSYVLTKDVPSGQQLLHLTQQIDRTIPNMTVQALPMFDHMAIFYQEAAMVEAAQFHEKQIYESLYQRKLDESPRSRLYLDPLADMRKTVKMTGAGQGGAQ
jgi:hypothetical protein